MRREVRLNAPVSGFFPPLCLLMRTSATITTESTTTMATRAATMAPPMIPACAVRERREE